MKFFKSIFDFYLNASIHVAFSVLALLCISIKTFNIPEDKNLIFATFFGTIVIYNFIKYGSRAKQYFYVERRYEKIIQFFSFFSAISACFFLIKLDSPSVFISLLILGLISILYVVPFYNFKINLRNLSGAKIFIVAFVWAGCTVLLPLFNEALYYSNDIVITYIQRFLFVIVITLPFEIRDMSKDAINLHTIPQLLGIRRTKILGTVLILLFWGLEFFKDDFNYKNLFILLLIKTTVILFLLFSKSNQSKYYSSFYVESIPILWWAAILFF